MLPWIVGYLPLLAWTFAASGSPYGPIFSGVFGPTVYDLPALSEHNRIYWAAHPPFSVYEVGLIVSWSPLVWIGLLGWPIANVSWSVKGVALYLILVQVAVVIFGLKGDPRYLGGVQYGLAIGLLLHAAPVAGQLASSKAGLIFGSALFLLPWLGVQTYYATQFIPVALGLQDRESFVEAKTAFRKDFRELDRLLPADAVLLVANSRLNSVYSPRPVYFDAADLPAGVPVYWFVLVQSPLPEPPAGFQRGSDVYENREAVTQAYRTPGKPRSIGCLRVVELIRSDDTNR